MKRLFTLSAALLAVLIMLLSGTSAQAQGDALIRFVHAIPGASPVDVYTDGQLTSSGLAFGSATTYANIPAGDHQLTVTIAGSTTPIWQQTVSAANGAALTLVAATASSPNFLVYQDDLNALGLGKARLTAIHAISGGPTVDLLLSDGRPVIPGLEFGKQAGTLDVPTFAYDLVVVPAGQGVDQALLSANGVALATGTSYILVVYGTPDNPQAMALAAPTAAEAPGGFVRVMHGVVGAPAVDVYINDTLAVPALDVAGFTQHVAIPAGTYDVALRAAGSSENLTSVSLTVETGKAVTVAALGSAADLRVNVFEDDISGIEAGEARLALINGLSDGENLSAALDDGTRLGNGIAFGSAGDAVSIAPSSASITLSAGEVNSQIAATNFYGGVYYNLLALNDGGQTRLVIAPTSLAQGIASAPGADTVIVAAQPTTAPVQATLPPIEPVVVLPTVTPAPATAGGTGITGRVFNLNADSNLQLRQYPSSNALSLATVPPNTILAVNGRDGEIVTLPNSATPVAPQGYVYTDPVTLLTENQDLDPATTWINVTYTTPDGGTITAWASALYIDLRNARGERVPLRNLPTVAANTPGDRVNTAVTSPPVASDRVAATVFNLNPGVNLNIRRIADVNGEVLARVTNGTVMEFLGIKEDRQWVFVRYLPPEGGSVTGWVSALYVQFSLNSRLIKLEDMEARGLLVITPDDERGEVDSSAITVVIPTVDPVKDAYVAVVVLDPGSNLNLRRNPDANSQVLAQIPSGTQLLVTARTGDERWLNVTFEGTSGWIAARTDTAVFVRLTLNGRPAEISAVPVQAGDTTTPAAPGISTPVPGPTATGGLPLINLPVRVTDVAVQMTGSPGGSADGLPLIFQGQEATLLFTDGQFSYIELPDFTRGWVPAGAVQPR